MSAVFLYSRVCLVSSYYSICGYLLYSLQACWFYNTSILFYSCQDYLQIIHINSYPFVLSEYFCISCVVPYPCFRLLAYRWGLVCARWPAKCPFCVYIIYIIYIYINLYTFIQMYIPLPKYIYYSSLVSNWGKFFLKHPSTSKPCLLCHSKLMKFLSEASLLSQRMFLIQFLFRTNEILP